MTPSVLAEHQRLERTLGLIRYAGAGIAFAFGPLFPGLSVPAILALAAGITVYDTLVLRASSRAHDISEHRRIEALAFAADLVAVALGMLITSVDPYWTTFVVGPLLIVGGAFRFGSAGAWVSAVVLGTAYLAISVVRGAVFGLAVEPQRVGFHIAIFVLSAALIDRVLLDDRRVRVDREDLIRRLQRRLAEDAAIDGALRVVASGPGRALVPAVLEASRSVFRFDRATVFVADRDRGEYIVAYRIAADAAPPTPAMRLGEGLVGVAFTEGRALRVRDVLEDPRYMRRPDGEEHRSVIIVPLSVGGEPVAALSLSRSLPDGFVEDDVRLAETVGVLIAQVLENDRLFAEASEAKALRELDRLKDDFLAAVSHDLRTPLTVISASFELLAKQLERLPSDAARLIDRGSAHVQRLQRSVDELLDIAQLQEARIELQKEFIGARSLFGEALAAHEAVAAAKRQRVIVSCAADLPPVLVDRRRMQQILSNLLQNAARYAPEGSAVELRAERIGDEILFSVSDEGPGIPAAERDRVFDKFYRGVRTKGTTTGTGLGLAIARTLVELHGGRIWVEDRAAGGARFVVGIPHEPAPALVPA